MTRISHYYTDLTFMIDNSDWNVNSPSLETMALQMAFEMCYYRNEVYQKSLGRLHPSLRIRLGKIDYIL